MLSEMYAIAKSDRLQPKAKWQWSYGTEELTELFEMGFRDLDDLKNSMK